MEVKQELKELARQVKLLLLDVDGVLTDGRIIYDSRGRDMKLFDVHDGLGGNILKKYNWELSEVCFVGDDLVDLCMMKRVGFPVAVFNAAPEIKQSACYITLKEGGRGAGRE